MICIDTSVLVSLVTKAPSPKNQNQVRNARAWLAECHRKKEPFLLSAVVYAEFLHAHNETAVSQRESYIEAISEQLGIYAFDGICASFAAELQVDFYKRFGRPDTRYKRAVLKADAMIAATAIVHNASKIVTHDLKDFRRLVDGQIAVEDAVPEQVTLGIEFS